MSPTEQLAAPARGKGTGANRAYQQLRREILTLQLAPGVDLDENQLVTRLGMSRTPIREALVRLAGDGLVLMHPNRGAQVSPIDLANFPRYVEALDLLQRAVTRFAAIRRSDADLAVIEKARDDFETAVRRADILVLTDLNRMFHAAIGRASQNPYLCDQYHRLLSQGMRMLRIPFAAYEQDGGVTATRHVEQIIGEHRAIVLAIRQRAADAAEQLAAGHTQLFRTRLLRYLEEIQRSPIPAAEELGRSAVQS